MSSARQNPAMSLIKGVLAIVALGLILMLIMGYWGTYRSSAEDADSTEATETVEATATAEGEEEGEGEVEASSTTVVVLIEGLNFRTAPSRDAELIRGLSEGETLLFVSSDSGWYKVRTQEGEEGFVSASGQYTRLEE